MANEIITETCFSKLKWLAISIPKSVTESTDEMIIELFVFKSKRFLYSYIFITARNHCLELIWIYWTYLDHIIYFSSIVNEVIRTISSLFIFFYKNILSLKKAPKCKINTFLPLRIFCAEKIVAFVVFCLLVFVLLVSFDLTCLFVRLKLFRKKNKKKTGLKLSW